METPEEKKLQKEVAGKYQVPGNNGVGEYHWNGNIVHLERIDLETADRLVGAGFPYLVATEVKTGKKDTQKA